MQIYIFLFAVWLVGAVASNAVQRVLGSASPHTYGDSFSGDDTLDLVLIIAWPIFWPCWSVHKAADRTARWSIETDPRARGIQTTGDGEKPPPPRR
jgi:hypothetical protein